MQNWGPCMPFWHPLNCKNKVSCRRTNIRQFHRQILSKGKIRRLNRNKGFWTYFGIWWIGMKNSLILSGLSHLLSPVGILQEFLYVCTCSTSFSFLVVKSCYQSSYLSKKEKFIDFLLKNFRKGKMWTTKLLVLSWL